MCARARSCACACNERCVCACAFLLVCVHLCACVLACMRPCTRAFVSACACVRASLPDRIFARVCVVNVFMRSESVCSMSRRCARPLVERRRRAVFIARPAPRVGGRARVVSVRFHRPGSRARWPQVSRGRTARPARRGLRETGTRPWSTLPAPSTSSAAATPTAAASTRTCGRAPTEVRGPDSVKGGGRRVLDGYSQGYYRVLRGTKGVQIGY